MLSDRYMYKLSEPWETGRFSSLAFQTPVINANWVFCVFMPFTSFEILVCSSENDTSVTCERLRAGSAH